MSGRVVNFTQGQEPVSPYAPSGKSRSITSIADDRVDQAGQAVLDLLGRAADAADEHNRHALDIAHRLSRQLRAAEDQIIALEAELKHYKDRTDYAERWLQHIAGEVEQRFLRGTQKSKE